MNLLTLIEVIAAIGGLTLATLLIVFPRFGPASWSIVALLIPGVASTAAIAASDVAAWTAPHSTLFAFACLLLCGTCSCLASYTVERRDYAAQFRRHKGFFIIIAAAGPALVAALYVLRPQTSEPLGMNTLSLGPLGYASAVYLLLVSVIALANVEQTLRAAEEHVRWEIKFLLIGLASILGALVYIATQILLYAPDSSFISRETVRVFPAIFLCSTILMALSWRRATLRSHVVVSQGVIYSTITLCGVGLYLIASSLIARWADQLIQAGLPVKPIVFLMSAVLLAAVLLGTQFRHNTKRWIRRNVFAGRYDYRQSWMDATERVKATDSPSIATAALADLCVNAIGSLDVSVWLRKPNSDQFSVAAARGSIAETLSREGADLLQAVQALSEPVTVSDPDENMRRPWPPDFLKQTKASLLAPLISSDRVIGLLTVGTDRTGRSFDRETREFLRVIALHSASELHKSELLETLVAAREAEAFRTFSTFLLHDLKNFASTLSLIARNAPRHHANPDFQRDAFLSVLDTSEKMKKLCNSLRTFSSTPGGNKSVRDMNHIIRTLADRLDAGLSARLKLELSPIPAVMVDEEELTGVLQNLVLNSQESSPAESIIRVTTELEDGAVVVKVIDSGKGIPKDFLERALFHPFRTTKVDGLGIGLFQAKRIIEAHGGRIEVHSVEGQGTTVSVILPVTEYEKQAEPPQEQSTVGGVLARTPIVS